MGLKVSTIARLPIDSYRDYYVYFLDYGWSDDFSRALYDNFDPFAGAISGHRAVVVAGLNRTEFANEVLSWHKINGEDAADLLPAILLTDLHPQMIAESNNANVKMGLRDDHIILLPLKKVCQSPSDVPRILQKILDDIKAGTTLADWTIKERISSDRSHPLDMFVLEPNVAGIGIDLKAFAKRFIRRNPKA